MEHVKVTVYIVSHNYGQYLAQAIESVLRQTIDDWQLIIIDDNSTDNTHDIMHLYQGDERIRLFHADGVGLPAACNLALKDAKGKYIIRLDGDDIFEENILLVLSNWLDRNTNQAMVFPDYFFIDEYGMIFGQERREKINDINHIWDCPPNGACTMVRTQILKEIGGYREDLGAQDGLDLWNKISGRYKCGNINIPLFYYRRHSRNLTDNSQHILHARRKLKTDAITEKADNFRPIIGVIPCRRNYDFSPDVWKRSIQGKKLLEMNIEKCIRSKLFDHIVVASDNLEVEEVMKRFNDTRLVFFKRDWEDTIRSKSIASTLDKITEDLDSQRRGLTVLSYLQAPFVRTETLDEAVTTLLLNDSDCSIGVEEINDLLFKRSPHGMLPINPKKGLTTDFDVVYREANIALSAKNRNFERGAVTGPTIVHFIVPHDECFFIDSEQKLKIANILAGNS